MDVGYNQFCPIAKASEVFATRWTPLILRELMADVHSFVLRPGFETPGWAYSGGQL